MVNGLECRLQNSQVISSQACRFRNFFLGPMQIFFCDSFAAFPENATNNVDPADPTLFFALPGMPSPGLRIQIFKHFLETLQKDLQKKSSRMGPRNKFWNQQAWLGGQATFWPSRPHFGPDSVSKLGPKHQNTCEMGPESMVRVEHWPP